MSQKWDYAELSKVAKAAGGPEKLLDAIAEASRKEGASSMLPWVSFAAASTTAITVASMKIIDYFKVKKKRKSRKQRKQSSRESRNTMRSIRMMNSMGMTMNPLKKSMTAEVSNHSLLFLIKGITYELTKENRPMTTLDEFFQLRTA